RRLDLDDAVEATRPRHDAAVEALRVIGGGDVDDLVDLVRAVEPLQQLAVAVQLDDGVDVLEQADDRTVRLDLAEDLHGARQEAGMFTEDGDVPCLEDAVDDLMHDRALARALRTIEQVAAPVQVTMFLELLAQRRSEERRV